MQNPEKLQSGISRKLFLDLVGSVDSLQVEEIQSKTEEPFRTFYVKVPYQEQRVIETPSGPTNGTSGELEYHLRCAAILVEHGEFLLAQNIYSKILKKEIKQLDALKGFGVCLLGLGKSTLAMKCFNAFRQFSKDEEAFVWLGICFSVENQDERALEYFGKVTQPDKLSSTAQFEFYKNIGNCFTRVGKFEAAKETYEKALKFGKQLDTVYVNLGTLEMQLGHSDLSRQHFLKALDHRAGNDRAHCGLGFLAIEAQEYEVAAKALETALKLNPTNEVALTQLVNIAHSQREFDALAKLCCQAFLKRNFKNAEAHYSLASLHFRSSEWLDCDKELDLALRFEPKHERACKLKGELERNKFHG